MLFNAKGEREEIMHPSSKLPAPENALPLAGIRVLDLSRLLPGPYLTQLFADLGAEVIKIETPRSGDITRLAPAEMRLGEMFEVINRGKKSLAVNYRREAGRDVVLKLAATADVFLEGFRPGRAEKWGLDYAAVRRARPDIVYCSLSGYGQDGPYRSRAGHDLNYLAIGGALGLNGRPGEAPIPYGLPVADLAGGMLAAVAILGGLVGRGQNGRGMYLDMAMIDGVLSWMTPFAAGAYFNGIEVSPGGLPLLGGLPSFNVYETAEGRYIALAIVEPHFWSEFCRVTGRSDLLPRQFDRSIGREVASVFRSRTQQEWLAAFDGADACVEPVNSFEEMLIHPQVRARGYVREAEGKAAGLNTPFVFARREMTPAPALGEHTRAILAEMGMEDAHIDELLAEGIIACREAHR
ncbi:MAG: CaiB/BaiF CoA transferase family protein [Bacteroidota bacterium]